MVGRKEISTPNHQKKMVAWSSSCLARSRHFFALLVKILAKMPMGMGSVLATIFVQLATFVFFYLNWGGGGDG